MPLTSFFANTVQPLVREIDRVQSYAGFDTAPERQIAACVTRAAFAGAHVLKTLYKRYPGKTCGALAAPGSIAIAAQGLQTGDTALTAAGILSVAANTALLLFAERKRASDVKDPQDRPMSLKTLFDPRSHPHEFSCTIEPPVMGLLILGGLNAAGGNQSGYAWMGVTDLLALSLTFVPERTTSNLHAWGHFKNLPVIRQTMDRVQAAPLKSAALVYWIGDFMPPLQNLSLHDFDFTKLDGNILTTFAFYSMANVFLFGASKRQPLVIATPEAEKTDEALHSTPVIGFAPIEVVIGPQQQAEPLKSSAPAPT